MLHPLSFYRFYRKNRFAEALASLRKGTGVRYSDELWACYRLGMYCTVKESGRADNHWQGIFASSVSLAACGSKTEAADLARRLVKGRVKDDTRTMLADALAPFLPELSLELIEGASAPTGLQAALLLKNGNYREARSLLERALEKGDARHNPELCLFMSNAEQGGNKLKLERLNAFLDASALSPVALRDSDKAPGPWNIHSAVVLPGIDGPLVSVLMTAYESAGHIDTAISSLMQQTWRNIELIIIDDASTDNTGDVVREWMAQDARIRYIRLPYNAGTYVAKNIGLQYAKGEFVTCHDSDDWSHPLKIERQVKPLMKDGSLVCTISDWIRIQDDGVYYARPVHPLGRLNPSSPLFRRREVLDVSGAWDCVRTGADSEFAARLKLVFGRNAVLRLRQPLAFGAHRPGSLMTSPETGYSSTGISPSRLAYWEAWTYWHIDTLRGGRKPQMPPGLLQQRPFVTDEKHIVPDIVIQNCLNCLSDNPVPFTENPRHQSHSLIS